MIREIKLIEILNNSECTKWKQSKVSQYAGCGDFPYCAYCSLCSGCNYVEHNNYYKPAETNCYMAKIRYGLAQKLMKNYKELSRMQFVEALQKLPIQKVTMQRMYNTKG